MKRIGKLMIMLLCVFLLSGCTIVRINTDKIDTIVNVVLSKNNNLYNMTFLCKDFKFCIGKIYKCVLYWDVVLCFFENSGWKKTVSGPGTMFKLKE